MRKQLADIKSEQSDKILNFSCATVAFAASMGLIPLSVAGIFKRFPNFPLTVLYGAPVVLLSLFLVWIQLRWSRKHRAAGQAAVFGIVLNGAFWIALFYGIANSD
jgi:glucan phosphoethanolaminetransferase (alkaline phosphatase superfamily)